MATNGPPESATPEATTAVQDIADLSRPQQELPSSTPLERSSLASQLKAGSTANTEQKPPPPAPSIPTQNTSSSAHPISSPPSSVLPTSAGASSPQAGPSFTPAPVPRTFSTAIGPSSDEHVSTPQESTGPTLLITLLLTSGARHPFKLDSRYLTKRNVNVPDNDPFNLSGYKLKELILREWREEWEAKPSSPSYIRLISFGKLLDDKAPLKGQKFPRHARRWQN